MTTVRTEARAGNDVVAKVLVLGIVAAAMGYAAKGPPSPVSRSAPDSVFSAERAMEHVRVMAVRPHPTGSADNERVRNYLVAQLEALGLTAELQPTTAVGTRFQESGRIVNVMARLPGRASGGPAVLVTAHYDGVPGGPAAGDDASGCAVVLETLRALKAGPPLEHDVIALFTDGEEVGLLGAAAFVREHRWAKDVEMILAFEARGTGGQAVMFQTGPDNLDQIRVLRDMPNVSATSLAVTVYQFLPNDTDLSEFFGLAKPGLNFAFADGVERYHTGEDDPAHLDPGTVQQEGDQALGLARAFAQGPLPRPKTGSAVFFDLPLIGLVYYPERWARPLAVVGLVVALWALIVVVRREQRWGLGLVLGLVGLTLTLALGGLSGYLMSQGVSPAIAGRGPRGIFALGLTVLAAGFSVLVWAIVRRWAAAAALGLAPLLLWAGLAVAASWKLPGISFLPLWPMVAVAVATALRSREPLSPGALWVRRVPTMVACFIVVPIVYGMGLVALGIVGPGAIAIGLATPLVAWLLAEDLEILSGRHRGRTALRLLAVGLALVVWGRWAGRRNLDYPTPSVIGYAEDADSAGGWLFTTGSAEGSLAWGAGAIRGAQPAGLDSLARRAEPPRWLSELWGGRFPMTVVPSDQARLTPPAAVLIADTVVAGTRRLDYRIVPGAGKQSVAIRVVGSQVRAANVDGRSIDPSRYRYRSSDWRQTYAAPPDSGFLLHLEVPGNGEVILQLVAQASGLPECVERGLPPRPAAVLPIQTGNLSLVHRRVVVPPRPPR